MPRSISPGRLATLLDDAPRRSPAYREVATALRMLVDDGRVPAGTRLPSERVLADELGVSRTTITRAYARLVDAGFATARHGSGTVATLPDAASRDGRGALMPAESTGSADGAIDLTCAVLPPPVQLHAAYEQALSHWSPEMGGSGYDPLGVPALREAVAEDYTRRGLPTHADQVMITSGAIGAHAIAARAHLAPGERLLLDSPVYPNSLASLRAHGLRPVAVPLDEDGWDLDAWASAARAGARAALLLPDFHNPTGLLMSDDERARLSHILRRQRALALVDETLAGTALTGPAADGAMPAPFGAHHHRTVMIGGASKSHWSGLRIGWLRAPAELMGPLVAARTTLDLGSAVLEQLALLELMEHEDEIATTHREAATARRDMLASELRTHLPSWRFQVPDGGLSLWVELPEPVSTAFVVAAEARRVLLAPGPRFAAEAGLERRLRIPFTAPEATLREAVRRMAAAWEALDRRVMPRRDPARPLIA